MSPTLWHVGTWVSLLTRVTAAITREIKFVSLAVDLGDTFYGITGLVT